jgi:hypothetical protein
VGEQDVNLIAVLVIKQTHNNALVAFMVLVAVKTNMQVQQ